jgi:hypothetical protein
MAKIESVSKDKTKICGICLLGIDDSKEYAELIHYLNKKKIKGRDYYHIVCYQGRLSQNVNNIKLQSVALDTLIKAREQLGIRC